MGTFAQNPLLPLGATQNWQNARYSAAATHGAMSSAFEVPPRVSKAAAAPKETTSAVKPKKRDTPTIRQVRADEPTGISRCGPPAMLVVANIFMPPSICTHFPNSVNPHYAPTRANYVKHNRLVRIWLIRRFRLCRPRPAVDGDGPVLKFKRRDDAQFLHRPRRHPEQSASRRHGRGWPHLPREFQRRPTQAAGRRTRPERTLVSHPGETERQGRPPAH